MPTQHQLEKYKEYNIPFGIRPDPVESPSRNGGGGSGSIGAGATAPDNFGQIIADTRLKTDAILGTLNETMGTVKDLANKTAFDTEGMVGELRKTFDTNKSMMIDAALASTQKASYELDAYLGSAGGDSRTAVRRGMASQITTSMISATQQNVAALFNNHTDKIIETSLAGTKLNADIKLNAVATLADLAGKSANLVLGTNSAILDAYSSQLTHAVNLMNAQTSRMNSENQFTLGKGELELNRDKLQLAKDAASKSNSGDINPATGQPYPRLGIMNGRYYDMYTGKLELSPN